MSTRVDVSAGSNRRSLCIPPPSQCLRAQYKASSFLVLWTPHSARISEPPLTDPHPDSTALHLSRQRHHHGAQSVSRDVSLHKRQDIRLRMRRRHRVAAHDRGLMLEGHRQEIDGGTSWRARSRTVSEPRRIPSSCGCQMPTLRARAPAARIEYQVFQLGADGQHVHRARDMQGTNSRLSLYG